MKRIFFLTYYFPPLGGVASLRASKMAKYLLQFGWQPTVFHAGKGNYALQDPTLLDEVPKAIARKAVRTWEGAPLIKGLNRLHLGAISYRLLRLIPVDGQVGWIPGVLRAVRREIALHGKPDAIFSSSAPYSANVAGLLLHREFNIPWVADFRDEWTLNPALRFATPLHAKLATKLESEILSEAAVVTTVTQSWVEMFQRSRPAGKPPVILIPNGYDDDDFASSSPKPKSDQWTLAIVGSVYHSTDPYVIVEELAALIGNGAIDPATVSVVHVGNGKLKAPPGTSLEITKIGFVSHAEAIAWMQRVDALMMSLQPFHGAAASARIYEYIRSGTPVIAVVPEGGEASQLIREAGAGNAFSATDRQGIREDLLRHYRSWQEGKPIAGASKEKAAKYSRREGARQLAEILNAQVLSGS